MERVQSVAVQSVHAGVIPPEFVRPRDEQPAATTLKGVVLEVPVIDMDEGCDEKELIGKVSGAAREWGLFQVVNHGVPRELISELQRVGKEFFDLPETEKEAIAKTPESGIEGYGTALQKETQGKKGWVDHLFHMIWPPSAVNYKYWPQNPSSYRVANEEYAKRMKQVSDKLLRLLSLGLGLEEDDLATGVGGEQTNFLMKINYYPPCPQPDLVLGVVAHTDMSSLTILVPNHVQGLQVCRDGNWYDVKYIPNALIIHIGDQIEILSNGEYKAVLHRTTVNKEKTRMSWPVFVEPPAEQSVGPIPKLVGEKNPAKYKTKKYKDYVYCKLNKLPQ